MPTYKKRSESTLTKECLHYLQLLQNNKRIAHFDRLNSGKIFTGKYCIKLCKEGTPDIYALDFKTGAVYWIENKVKNEQLDDKQIEFRNMVSALPNHTYLIIRSIEELERYFYANK